MGVLGIAVIGAAVNGLACIAAADRRHCRNTDLKAKVAMLAAAQSPAASLMARRKAAPVNAGGSLAAGEAMTRREAAGLLGLSERDVRALGKSGVLAEIPQGGRATLVTAASVGRLKAAQNGSEPPRAGA